MDFFGVRIDQQSVALGAIRHLIAFSILFFLGIIDRCVNDYVRVSDVGFERLLIVQPWLFLHRQGGTIDALLANFYVLHRRRNFSAGFRPERNPEGNPHPAKRKLKAHAWVEDNRPCLLHQLPRPYWS